jgi:hypothetical protein
LGSYIFLRLIDPISSGRIHWTANDPRVHLTVFLQARDEYGSKYDLAWLHLPVDFTVKGIVSCFSFLVLFLRPIPSQRAHYMDMTWTWVGDLESEEQSDGVVREKVRDWVDPLPVLRV